MSEHLDAATLGALLDGVFWASIFFTLASLAYWFKGERARYQAEQRRLANRLAEIDKLIEEARK